MYEDVCKMQHVSTTKRESITLYKSIETSIQTTGKIKFITLCKLLGRENPFSYAKRVDDDVQNSIQTLRK